MLRAVSSTQEQPTLWVSRGRQEKQIRFQALTLLLILLLRGAPGLGQTATQGDPAKVTNPTEFHSPMVLETAFPSENALHGGRWVSLPEWVELGKFTCDGVALKGDRDESFYWDRLNAEHWYPGLKMKMQQLANGNVGIDLQVRVNNPKHNEDKIVNVRVEIVNGVEVVAAEQARIKAKDNGKANDALLTAVFPRASIRPTTNLRITMTTHNY